MKRIPIPASGFLDLLNARGPLTIQDFGIASESHTVRKIAELRAAGLAHIHCWQTAANGRPVMVVAAGPGQDAMRPKLTPKQAARKRSQQNLLYRERKKAEALFRPQLPTHTPTFGIWGI